MKTFMYFILLYALVIGILFVVYKLLSFGIDRYFRMHKARALSPTYPIIKAFSVLLIAFDKLVNSGKVVFILDGFDEMGYIGTHEQRIKQLNAIWQLATKRNKILITGRPTYFPNDKELVHAFNILDAEEQKVPQDNPYFERIELKEFEMEEIHASIKAYRYPTADVKKYVNFIENNSSIYDLCKRPVLMHMVREMLPLLFKDYKTEEINAGILMGHYISHWITRQIDKKIVSAVEDRKVKKEFVMDFFVELAAQFYQKEIETLPADDILPALKEKIGRLELKDKNEIEGFETEILSGYFIEIENDEYKFVHKSFKEYFVAQQILKLLDKKEFKHPLITKIKWTREIIDFVYDSDKIDKTKANDKKIPLLLQLTNNKFNRWLKNKIFRIYANLFLLDHKFPFLFSKTTKNGIIPKIRSRRFLLHLMTSLIFGMTLGSILFLGFKLSINFIVLALFVFLVPLLIIIRLRCTSFLFFGILYILVFYFTFIIKSSDKKTGLLSSSGKLLPDSFLLYGMPDFQNGVIIALMILIILSFFLLSRNSSLLSKAYYISVVKGQLEKDENKKIVYLLKNGFDYSDLELADEKTSSPEYQEYLAGT